MGCGPSKDVVVIATDSVKSFRDEVPLLNDDEALIVRLTWDVLKNDVTLVNLGKQVFLRIFNVKPDIKKMFPFSDAWGDALIRHPHFILHAERFMMVVDCMVRNLDSIKTEYTAMLLNLGRAHADFKGYSRENFEVFMKAIWFVWYQQLKDKMNSDVERAWKKLFNFIIDQLIAGYDAELSGSE